MNDLPNTPPHLVLYKYDACPFCRYVMSALVDLQLTLEIRDTGAIPMLDANSSRSGGKSQVPCLFIDGQPLYESRDIIQYLRRYAAHYSSSDR